MMSIVLSHNHNHAIVLEIYSLERLEKLVVMWAVVLVNMEK